MEKKLIQYFLLFTGFLILLSVTLPHHHHEDGHPCYCLSMEDADHPDHDGTGGEAAHDCTCNGHTIAFFSSNAGHFSDDSDLFLFPIQILFDYITPAPPAFSGCSLFSAQAVYIESRHDVWIVSASGLRAPPLL